MKLSRPSAPPRGYGCAARRESGVQPLFSGSSGKAHPASSLPRASRVAMGRTASEYGLIAPSCAEAGTSGQFSLTIRLIPSDLARAASDAVHWSISITGKNGAPATVMRSPVTDAAAVSEAEADGNPTSTSAMAANAATATADGRLRRMRNPLLVEEAGHPTRRVGGQWLLHRRRDVLALPVDDLLLDLEGLRLHRLRRLGRERADPDALLLEAVDGVLATLEVTLLRVLDREEDRGVDALERRGEDVG